MVAKLRALTATYTPGPNVAPSSSVGDLGRATWEELFRIAQSLLDLDRPVAMTLLCEEPVAVGPVLTYDRLFNEGVSNFWENPAAQIDTATGIWTCPQEGLYQIATILRVPPFPTPAVKEYYISLRITIVHIDGSPNEIIEMQNGGFDNVPIAASGTALRPFIRGDQLYIDAAIFHQTTTGSVTIKANLQIIRISGTK
jgi:hypothetical protein